MKGVDDDTVLRAVTMSNLMSIYIKRGIGRLSAMCGMVNAAMGVAAAVVYLDGGNPKQSSDAMKNMINTVTGMLCDGAKPSCALKMSVTLYAAFLCSQLALENHVVEITDGLSDKDIDLSIHNLGRIGKDGMLQTDDMILDIMTHKHNY